MFAVCCTRQRAHSCAFWAQFCRMPHVLPSVMERALGKDVRYASAFAVALVFKLYRVPGHGTLGIYLSFAECLAMGHSAKPPSPLKGRQPAMPLLFLAEGCLSTLQRLCRVPEKMHSAKNLCRVVVSEGSTW